MTYRDEVHVSRETIHRIVLRRMGSTLVDVAFHPDSQREITNGSLSIHGDFGPFVHYWSSTGCRYFSDFLADLRYDYAMGKLAMNRGGGYEDDWSTMPGIMKREVLRLRREDELTHVQARVLYDYFDNEYRLEGFGPQSYDDMRHAMEEELTPDFCRRERDRSSDIRYGLEYGDDVVPLEVMYGGETCGLPTPDKVRTEHYFWKEVWPVVVEEIRNLEHEIQREGRVA